MPAVVVLSVERLVIILKKENTFEIQDCLGKPHFLPTQTCTVAGISS